MRPFRFAVQVSHAESGGAWRELARKAESLGYSTMYIPDHFTDQWGPLVAMTVAAEATERLNVGFLVLDNDYRHPVVLAKEAATLDIVSEGRLEFGLGAGWMRSDYDAAGISYDEPKVRVDRMAEGLAVMKQLWADGKASFSGDHYTITDAVGEPRPHTRGGPRVVIGGGGRRVLSIAAREADIVGFNANLRAGHVGPEVAATTVAEAFDQRVAWVRDAAGERIDQLEFQCHSFMCLVVPNREEVAANMAPMFGLTPEQALDVPMLHVGTIDQIVETMQQRRERWGFSYIVVQGDALDAFAPVVERLAGT